MCCFSGTVTHVGGTKIFARGFRDGRQALVYAMEFEAAADLAMILPIPVPPHSPEDAVRFVDLSTYATFFDDLHRGFPVPAAFGAKAFLDDSLALEVHRVGAFEASFVPSPADFARLDPRFRLPDAAWSALPGYADWGFAVFKLAGGAERQEAHPMAFMFPRRATGRLFFPTVHVHDGAFHPTAEFAHTLYAQHATGASPPVPWWSTGIAASKHVDLARAAGLVAASHPVASRGLGGTLPNEDIWLDAADLDG